MKRSGKVLKWLAVAVVVVLIGMQFVRPARTNPAIDQTQTINARLQDDAASCRNHQSFLPGLSLSLNTLAMVHEHRPSLLGPSLIM